MGIRNQELKCSDESCVTLMWRTRVSEKSLAAVRRLAGNDDAFVNDGGGGFQGVSGFGRGGMLGFFGSGV